MSVRFSQTQNIIKNRSFCDWKSAAH